MGILAHKEIEKSVQMKGEFVKLCDVPKNLFSEQFCPGCTAVLLLLTAWVNFQICRYSSVIVRFLPLIWQQALVLFCKVTIWSVHIQSALYFSFTLCFWLLWLLQAGKYCAVGRAVFQLPEFLHSLNGKKQDFLGEPASHFYSALIQPLLYLQRLQSAATAAGGTKTPFSRESSFPSAPLSDHREVGWSTLSDRHGIHQLNKTPRGRPLSMLNEPTGMKTSFSVLAMRVGCSLSLFLHSSHTQTHPVGFAKLPFLSTRLAGGTTPAMLSGGMFQCYTSYKKTLCLICHPEIPLQGSFPDFCVAAAQSFGSSHPLQLSNWVYNWGIFLYLFPRLYP